MLSAIINILYPRHCCLCGADSLDTDLCQACAADLPLNSSCCCLCALPMVAGRADQLCADCLKKIPPYDKVWSPFVYAQPVEWMIQQLKFNHKLYFARLLAQQMWRHKPVIDMADCIIPIPLHEKRLRQRGFNQSMELARELSRLSSIPVDNISCQRRLHTDAQTGKTAQRRRRNIRHAFSYNRPENCRRVIVLDDVITTASTVAEVSSLLKQQGIDRVDVWSVARAGRE